MPGHSQIKKQTLHNSLAKAQNNFDGIPASKFLFGCLLALLCFITNAKAQAGKIPPFTMVQANGRTFTSQSLPKDKPLVLIYFSPECEHCQKLMNDLFKRVTDFNKASLVMITYLSPETVKSFATTYQVNKYPNIFVGTEGTGFFLRNHYSIMNMPFTALYDKNGNLVTTFKDDVKLSDITNRLALLK